MIELNNVSMKFRMANDRIMNLKEYIVKKISGKLEYKEFVALNDISFSIEKGEVIGIVGSNGAGKSTLLKIISGILTPSQGSVQINGSIAPMLELGAGFDIDLTARENIFLNGAVLGYSKKYLTDKYDEIVEFSELQEFIDVPIRNFSSGMTMRLAFSIATLVNPDILIVDEILSVGDAHFQKKSSQRMQELMSGGTTVILVSHSIEQIRQMCTRVLWLEHGTLKMIGDTDEVCDAYINSINGVSQEDSKVLNSYRNDLYTPTCITKYDNQYFIVDCWHHRVIYNNNLTAPINKWRAFRGDFTSPHSLASDGNVFLVEDTENDSVKVFRKRGSTFIETQIIRQIGHQPNKLVYDSNNKLFYGIAASSQQIFVLKNTGEDVIIEKIKKLECLENSYVRAISLIDNKLYIVSGPGKIIVVKTFDLSFELMCEYKVPFELQGMNDIIKIGSYYYISVYQNGAGDIAPKLVRTQNLDKLEAYYEDIYDQLYLKGVPYYFTLLDERVFLTEIDSYSSIKSFKVIEDNICDIKMHYDVGAPNESSLKRRNSRFA
ncbi:ATP-binding cassette domain-containing protein [Paenibacillus sp. N3/727]|uniref:ATP-binding cassette domain-containing protein n=1 Tax=Paenibacillus sp. N3/727 TaxID=2925845 RepID=UPI001F530CEC|nr:ATP-binding cassette domain-containing protein [Paenibacillus sp. N3/727]UNK18019.1 ATP-binding cassette domain-containing protein [Paenibacillus sp. N3/727]